MSVLKANRKPSPFEVEHYAYKIRTVITDLALRKFGLKEYIEKPKPEAYSKWNQQQKDGYDKSVAKNRERYEACYMQIQETKKGEVVLACVI
jgi:hypothetical protein